MSTAGTCREVRLDAHTVLACYPAPRAGDPHRSEYEQAITGAARARVTALRETAVQARQQENAA